jgi:hypothetical protein
MAEQVRSQFRLVQSVAGTDVYVGSQTVLYQFIEFACGPDPCVRNAQLIINPDGETLREKYHILRRYSRFIKLVAKEPWEGNAQNLSHQFALSEAGEIFLKSNNPTEKVYSVSLRCPGTISNNIDGASGSNCQKYAANPGWCSSIGKCSVWVASDTGFLKRTQNFTKSTDDS